MKRPSNWAACEFQDLLEYIQPTRYIVESTEYNDRYDTPVLTAGKSFIKGYTNETKGIFNNLPTIIFDDFTTASKFVNFLFKVKSSAMKILVPSSKLVNLKFIYYCMQVNKIRSDTHKRYWISVYAKKQLYIPPLSEQNRIVAKIEELFSELDKGIESLRTAREQLKVYRQAVLKHAFEGKLTAQWREENKDKLEAADQLLARIKKEREARYQQRLEEWEHVTRKWEYGGKKGKRPSKPRKQSELKTEEDEFSELSSLPDSWNWVLLNDLTEHIVDGTHKTPKYTSSGIYFISAKDIKDFRIDFSNTRFIDKEQHADLAKRCLPKVGNVLITKSGTIGRVAAVETETEFSLFESVANIPTLPPMIPKFLALACFHIIDTYFGVRKQKGVAVRHLHLEDIRRLPISLPSSSEQLEIAKNLEHIFSMIDHQEMMIDSEITRADVLRQSILKKSFSGRLVPQDLNDEPASVLLERIKAEKAKQAKPGKKNKRKSAA